MIGSEPQSYHRLSSQNSWKSSVLIRAGWSGSEASAPEQQNLLDPQPASLQNQFRTSSPPGVSLSPPSYRCPGVELWVYTGSTGSSELVVASAGAPARLRGQNNGDAVPPRTERRLFLTNWRCTLGGLGGLGQQSGCRLVPLVLELLGPVPPLASS